MKKPHYLDNEKFTEAINKYIEARETNPNLTLKDFEEGDFIGLGIMKICINQTKKSNFATYTYRDEMIADAIENCIRCVKNFTIEKSSNAFGYFSLVAERAYIRRIQKEKKMNEKKYRYLSDTKNLSEVLSNQFSTMEGHENDVQQFVEQIQSALLENDQLVIIQSKHKSKRKSKNDTSISRLLKEKE